MDLLNPSAWIIAGAFCSTIALNSSALPIDLSVCILKVIPPTFTVFPTFWASLLASWFLLLPVNKPTAVYNFKCIIKDTNIYCIDGYTNNSVDSTVIEIYDTINNIWKIENNDMYNIIGGNNT